MNYIDDYTGFSSNPAEQVGHYIVLHFDTGAVADAKITVTVTNPVVLDDDGIVVLLIRDKDQQTITVVAEKQDYATVRKVYRLTDLTLAPQGQG